METESSNHDGEQDIDNIVLHNKDQHFKSFQMKLFKTYFIMHFLMLLYVLCLDMSLTMLTKHVFT